MLSSGSVVWMGFTGLTPYDPRPDPLWLAPGPDARVACEPGQGLTAAAISSRRPVPLVSWASTKAGQILDAYTDFNAPMIVHGLYRACS